jgi:hypothetical protein
MPRHEPLPDPAEMMSPRRFRSSKRSKTTEQCSPLAVVPATSATVSIDLRCREAVGDAFQMCDELPLMVFKTLDLAGDHSAKVPKYGRVVTWVPKGSLVFALYFREHVERKPVEKQLGGMAFPTMLNQQERVVYKPEAVVFIPEFGIPLRGTNAMVLTQGERKAQSNTALLCAYSDEQQYPHEPGYKRQERDPDFRVFVFDVLMFNGMLMDDYHPVERNSKLQELAKIGCLPPHFRVQEIMDQVNVRNNVRFAGPGGETLDPWVPMGIVELTMLPACPVFYEYSV